MNLTNVICVLLLVGKHHRSENHTLYFTEVQKSLISLLVKGMNSWLIESFTFHISRLYLKGRISILSSLSHWSRQVSMIAGYQETCRHTWIKIWKKKKINPLPRWQNIKGCVLSWNVFWMNSVWNNGLKVKYLTLGLNPEFLIKITGFLCSALCFRKRGHE